LDWDNRMPKLATYRVRHLVDDWRPLSVEELIALQSMSDLVIGIDSGPFHLTRLTGTPALGVFANSMHHPVKFCAPCENQVSLVPQGGTDWIDKIARVSFRLLEEKRLDAPTIAKHAIRLLRPQRYLKEPHQIGDDLLLQHWILDRCKTRKKGKLSNRVDRDQGFDRLLIECAKRFVRPNIVETGCVRASDDWEGAGGSTLILGLFAQATGGKLTSIDLSYANLEFARYECREINRITYVEADSVTALRRRRKPIDVLLLDSMDTEMTGYDQHCLEEFRATENLLHDDSLVVIDDTVYEAGTFKGKGASAVPVMLEKGWRILFSGYQTILSR
ncbi:MAG: class I SAM-dependent methyltransferase, partial [Verrucomicrobiota bacterium]